MARLKQSNLTTVAEMALWPGTKQVLVQHYVRHEDLIAKLRPWSEDLYAAGVYLLIGRQEEYLTGEGTHLVIMADITQFWTRAAAME